MSLTYQQLPQQHQQLTNPTPENTPSPPTPQTASNQHMALPNLTSSTSHGNLVGSERIVFNVDQVTCVCEALQQSGDHERLASFLWQLPVEHVSRQDEPLLKARAAVAFHRGDFRELYSILDGHEFASSSHPSLQQMWYKAHYLEAQKVRSNKSCVLLSKPL